MDNPSYEAQAEALPEKVDPGKGEPPKEGAMAVRPRGGGDIEARSDEDEKILAVLREVVRKCTNADPMKRPTAAEVLDMLKID